MLKDIYQDQLLSSHPSRTWTPMVVGLVTDVLQKNNWTQIESNQIDHVRCTRNNQALEINLTHVREKSSQDHDIIYLSDCVINRQHQKVIGLWPEVFGVYHHDFVYNNCLPDQLFSCFIHRGCPFRQSWMYQFVKNNLLDHGYVTYWCEDRFNRFTPEQNFEQLFRSNNLIFEQQHQQLIGKIPFKNFDFSIEHAIIKSQKNLIIETFFEYSDVIAFSEKTWRSIQLPRPWLMFNCLHAVRYLRQWGFDVFDDYIDHSYDTEPDPIVRQMMILEQLKQPLTYSNALLQEFETRAQRNCDLLKKYQKLWPAKLNSTIDEIKNL